MERLERFSLSSKSLGAKTPLQVHSEQELEAEKGSAKPTKGLARQERPNTSKGCVQTVFKNCLLCQDAKNHHARPCTKRHRLAGHSGPKNFCMKRALVGFARHAILIVVYGGSANSVCQACRPQLQRQATASTHPHPHLRNMPNAFHGQHHWF